MFPKKLPVDKDQIPSTGNGSPALRTPWLDDTTHILILIVVLVPIIFTLILCTITFCIYRYNKKRSARAPTNGPIVPTDRSGARIATVIYNTQHSPFVFEELPPSYDSLADVKKAPHYSNEQVQLTIVPDTTLTNTNEGVTEAAAIHPTAPIAPPSYINLDKLNKQ